MKKYFFLFLFLIFPFFSNSQSVAGIKAGFDHYKFFGGSTEDHRIFKVDYLGSSPVTGVFWRERSGHTVQMAAELTYVYRSFFLDTQWGGLGAGNILTCNYFLNNITLRLEPQFVFGRKLKFYIYPGFYFNYDAYYTVSGTHSTWSVNEPGTYEKLDSHDSFCPRFWVGVCAGTGLEYTISKN